MNSRLLLKMLMAPLMAAFLALAAAAEAPAGTYHAFALDVKDLAYTIISITNPGTTDVSVTVQAYSSEGTLTGSEGTGTIAPRGQWNLTTGSGFAPYAGAPQDFLGYVLVTTSTDAVALFGTVLIYDANGLASLPLTFTNVTMMP